jgi:RNA polymerase sigma-70 factor (ECF subfamily)
MGEADEDQAWIEQSLQGDPSAFEPLVRRYQKRIHVLAFRMTGSLADADDLAQEVFVQAFQRLAQFRRESRFSTWLHRIAVHQALHWLARQDHRQRLHQSWTEETLAATTAPNPACSEVQSALLKLPAKQRAAIVLTIYDGLSHAEAAHILGCSENTVSWRVFMARSRLKRLLRNPSPRPGKQP